MYRLDLNNHYLNKKSSTIYTPKEVSQFLFNLLSPLLPNPRSLIVDPCCGGYSLLKPWQQAGYKTIGIDNDFTSQADYYDDFLQLEQWIYRQPTLILCNPPFNGNKSKLMPEVWFDQIVKLFGKNTPIVFFAPIGFRLNHTLTSKRYLKFANGEYPPITSQIALTRDVYNLEPTNRKTEFHSEILIFNIHGLENHYFFTPN